MTPIIRRTHAAALARDASGAAAVEFAFIAPVLFLMLLGSMEGGRMLWTQNALQYAVEQTARCVAVRNPSCATSAQAQSYAAKKAYGLKLDTSVFSMSSAACGTQISASLPFKALSLVPLKTTLKAQFCLPS